MSAPVYLNQTDNLLGFLFPLVFLVEALNSSCGIDDLLLTREEGVTFVAKLNPQGLACGTGRKRVTTGARDLGIREIFRMDFLFHWLLSRVNADPFLIFGVGLKFYHAIYCSKESVIPSAAYINPRVDLGTALPDDNCASMNCLAAEAFNPEPF